jgi:hypothetical protein
MSKGRITELRIAAKIIKKSQYFLYNELASKTYFLIKMASSSSISYNSYGVLTILTFTPSALTSSSVSLSSFVFFGLSSYSSSSSEELVE